MVRLGDVFPLIRNGASIKQTNGAGGYPITRIETIANREIDRSKFGYADIKDVEKYQDYLLQDGDILMSHINSEKHLGKVALYHATNEEKIIHGMNLLMLRANRNLILSDYAAYFFNSEAFLRQIPNITKKSVNQASFTVTALKELAMPVPELSKQRDISEKLDNVSTLIYLRKEQLAKLDELVKSRYIEQFGNRGENPFNYPTTTMGNVYKFQYGKGNNIPEDKGEYPCYGSNGVVGHHTEFNSEDSPIIGHIGAYAGIVNWGKGKHYVTYNGVICKLINDQVNPVYGYYLLQIQDYNTVAKSGAAQPFVSYKDLDSPIVNVPPLGLQNQFAAFVEQTDKSKLAIQESLAELVTLKKALMQKYFG